MNSIDIRRSRALAALACAVAFAAAPSAPASEVAAPPSGVMTFPNVRVVDAPGRARPAFAFDGMKAFIDSESGALAEPSFEQLADLQRARGHRKPDPKARPVVHTLANGALKLEANASMINLSIARLSPAGRLAMACTPADAVDGALLAGDGEVLQ